MKKLLSLCLAAVMMVCLLAGISINAADSATYEYFNLRRENFGIVMGQPSSTGWSTQNIGGDMQSAGCWRQNPSTTDYSYGTTANAKAADVSITTKVYIDTPGAYTAFMHVEQSGNGFRFAIDGQETTTLFGATESPAGFTSAAYYFATEKADRTWTLSEGWHTITITSTAAGGKFQAVFLTNNTALVSSDLTHERNNTNATINSKVNMAVYEDFTAPTAGTLTVTPDANVANEHRTSVTLTWSGAADASGIATYEIKQGNEWVDVTDMASYTVNDLWAASEYTFTLRVTDNLGYTAETTGSATTNGPADTEAPTWTGTPEITVENASFSSTITFPAAIDNRAVSGYDIYEGSVATENLIATVEHNDTDPTFSYPISLEPGTSKDVVVVARDLFGFLSTELNATVESLAGTENFTLREGNFDISGGWSLANISEAMTNLGCTQLNLGTKSNQGASRGQALRAASKGGTATAEIYVDTPGDYVLFAQTQSGWKVKASIGNDPEGNDPKSGYLAAVPVLNDANQNTYVWAKADRVWTLEAGWNTVKLSAEDAAYVTAVYVTNGVNVEANEITYIKGSTTLVSECKLNIARYEDTEAPTFAAGNLAVSYNVAGNAATITWPTATDNVYVRPEYTMPATGFKEYSVKVNGENIATIENVSETTFTINETTLGRALVPGEKLQLKVEAVDILGNKAKTELNYEVSKFVISNFAILDNTTATLTIKNVSEAAADVRLSIAIYDAAGDFVTGNYSVTTIANDSADVTVTTTVSTGVPADLTGYTIKAHLWNTDLSPVSANWPTRVQ